MEFDAEAASGKSRFFNLSFSLGDLAKVVAIMLTCAGFYGGYTSLETKVNALEQQNLPPRVQALEAQGADLRDNLADMRSTLKELLQVEKDRRDKGN